CWQDIELPLTF
nr:immunoglobulin light chain junction region [Macaca mulatta]